MCDKGGAPDFFKPIYNMKVKIHGCLVATKVDFIPLLNIPSFKICMVTQKPCFPITIPWEDTWQVKIMGKETLVGESKCRCNLGGTIEFLTSGQIPLPEDVKAEVDDMKKKAQKELDDAGYGDSVGETGFWEGMIPLWGSGRDLINDIQTGDVGEAIMNGIFLIWDVGSIAAGVVSFGLGTAAMQGTKAGIKGFIKGAGKKISQKALQVLGKAGFKKLSKEALHKSMKELAKKIKCFVVKGCFTGDTLIHTKNGLIEIRNIKIDDEVFSYDEEKGEITLRKVTCLFEEEADEILEIQTERETIRTTCSHPFYVNGEFKDAEQIENGDVLLSVSKQKTRVISLNYLPESVKVYNFEVETDHCYFVGEEGILVLNVCGKFLRELVSQVPDAYKKLFKCKEFADAYKKILKNEGIEGTEVFLKSETGFIWSETLGKTITENGEHVGIKVRDMIFDNLHPQGISYKKWLDDLGVGLPGMKPPIKTSF